MAGLALWLGCPKTAAADFGVVIEFPFRLCRNFSAKNAR
jgi:hypothetical protein